MNKYIYKVRFVTLKLLTTEKIDCKQINEIFEKYECFMSILRKFHTYSSDL